MKERAAGRSAFERADVSDRPPSRSSRPAPLHQPIRRWAARLWNLPLRRSLRVQFTLAMLAVLLPVFALSTLVVSRKAERDIARLTRARLLDDANLLSLALRQWGAANQRTLAAMSMDPVLREGDREQVESLFQSLQPIYPYRTWALFHAGALPQLLAYSGGAVGAETRQVMERSLAGKPAFQHALNGWAGYGFLGQLADQRECLMLLQPVYRSGRMPLLGLESSFSDQPSDQKADSRRQQPDQLRSGERPSAVLVSCLSLAHLGRETGLQTALSNTVLGGIQGMRGDFQANRPLRRVFVLRNRGGYTIYPTRDGVDTIPPEDHNDQKGYWGPLFQLIAARSNREKQSFDSVEIGGEKYFVLLNQIDPHWHSALIMSETYAYATLNSSIHSLLLYALISVPLACLAASLLSGRLIAPIRVVSRALHRISAGDFAIHLQHSRRDELGELLDDVNSTAEQLKGYLSRELAGAVTRKQLDTARVIQKDFLVATIPESENLEIDPVSIPAYEVGADWYDVVTIGETIYIVVADVCDKGIASALYMSVFRSLLRYGLLAPRDGDCSPDTRLGDVVSSVNDYMATNHGDSMMFATVFIAAVQPGSGELHYISAGHEMPLIAGSSGLRPLPPTGPAMGLFAGAICTVQEARLEPGDYLVAYTDGLTDARSPDDSSWGGDALRSFLAGRWNAQPGAAELRADLMAAVQAHMVDTPPFDDLTLMVLHRVR